MSSSDLTYRLQISETEVIELCPHPGRDEWGVLVITKGGTETDIDLDPSQVQALAYMAQSFADRP